MLTTKEIDGVEVHAQIQILDDGFNRIVPILGSHGEHIPAYICICGADDELECECGAWDREVDED